MFELPSWVTLPMFSVWEGLVGEAKSNACRLPGGLTAMVGAVAFIPMSGCAEPVSLVGTAVEDAGWKRQVVSAANPGYADGSCGEAVCPP